ncbi:MULTISPECIES: HlyD family secretion protein [unclassified Photobacterium]|uniref:HlyD family secretion protein n=1 Tax=unclassified Photobacterium TaxID=2628852 RepID=UPI001EDD20D5|nr:MULTISPECIES: HlyD family secretion protein [unclassified Photobacterium]MCG3863485.1 HlyD family secretion protein [Photobacterium sp. Ph6]MCG3875014.1 HlyD family secretion protein [Photobacterium sp. Ph5]
MATTDISPSEQLQASESNSHLFRNLFIFIILAALLGTAGYFYVRHQKLYPATDDAYVHANILYVAPQISGKVMSVNVSDYQHVAEGDLLLSIDPAPFEIELEKAKAAYEVATQQNKATDDAILAASANVRSADATLVDVQKNYRRVMDLVNRKLLPLQQGDDAKAKLASAQTALEAARAKMSQLINQQGAKGDEAPQVKQAAAALSQATLNLSYTNIYAPYDGRLGKVSVRPGSIVSPGLSVMPLIEDNTAWLQANYKEKSIGLLKQGMKASIVLDMYPDVTYQGHVIALSPASGSSFSLLPPENATGNWVKVPQRFPVRIHFDDLKGKPLLRVGASAEVTIDTLAETK